MAQLFFKKPLQEAIRDGGKTTTLRRWSKPGVKVGERVFSPGLGWLAIEEVERVDLDGLNDRDALADGFVSLLAMRDMLDACYPDHHSDGKMWFRVRFRLAERYIPGKRKLAGERDLWS